MKTCPVHTLREHSGGDTFRPTLKENNRYQLQSDSGRVLVGFRGNPYNFVSEKTAQNWLCSNLSRFKNATGNTSTAHIVKLHEIYAQDLNSFVLDEIKAIAEYESGLWQVVECSNATELTEIDGGNAFTED